MSGANRADGVSKRDDFFIAVNEFGVADAELGKFAAALLIDTDPGDDQRTEKISLAAFVDAAVRSDYQRSRICGGGRRRFRTLKIESMENFRFQSVEYKLFSSASLHHEFAAFISDDGGMVSGGFKYGIRYL